MAGNGHNNVCDSRLDAFGAPAANHTERLAIAPDAFIASPMMVER